MLNHLLLYKYVRKLIKCTQFSSTIVLTTVKIETNKLTSHIQYYYVYIEDHIFLFN